jgi:hypothetical protein
VEAWPDKSDHAEMLGEIQITQVPDIQKLVVYGIQVTRRRGGKTVVV